MLKIVLDTNSLIVSIGRKSEFRPIFEAIINGKIKLLISNDIISEYVEKLTDKTTALIANNITEFIINSKNVEKVDIYFKWDLISGDRDDNKFVDCALNGGASFLITDDRHFDILKGVKFPHIEIIRTKKFTDYIKNL